MWVNSEYSNNKYYNGKENRWSPRQDLIVQKAHEDNAFPLKFKRAPNEYEMYSLIFILLFLHYILNFFRRQSLPNAREICTFLHIYIFLIKPETM